MRQALKIGKRQYFMIVIKDRRQCADQFIAIDPVDEEILFVVGG